MKFYVPSELTDPMVRDTDHITHGETFVIDELAAQIETRRVRWLNEHPGWVFTGTSLVKCGDGAPSPAYDVALGFRRPRTPAELEAQKRDHERYVAQKEAEFARREEDQKALLQQVLESLAP